MYMPDPIDTSMPNTGSIDFVFIMMSVQSAAPDASRRLPKIAMNDEMGKDIVSIVQL